MDAGFLPETSTTMPKFVLGSAQPKRLLSLSPVSPSSHMISMPVPMKEHFGGFLDVEPSFESHEQPSTIMTALQDVLKTLDCRVKVVRQWSLHVRCLCVAEEIDFRIYVTTSGDSHHVDFALQSGDELRFCDLANFVIAQCGMSVENDLLLLMREPLDAWMDAKQELSGRRFALNDRSAKDLIDEVNADLHIETLYEVAKSIKDKCRHKGNRKLFLQTDRERFIQGLQWMMQDSETSQRYALFILLQFAQDRDESAAFFSTPLERSSFTLLLDAILSRDCESEFTSQLARDVQQSAIFA